ncbi:MAG TPA: hypothetical protein VIX80_01730 [Candidatus Kapabacteria bacterium]
MKTLINRAALLAIIVVLVVSKSFAASDYLLELDGVKGECKGKHIKLTENADGSFSVENIPAGTYNVIYKAKQGKTGSAKRGDGSVVIEFEGVVSPRDVSTGQSSGKRDAASGQATGKRQHKPIRIVKEWDANTPMLIMGQITVGDDDNDGVDPAAKGAKTAGYDLKMAKKV